ncbi:hypothetical protein DL771_007516 [Monosporascus sp. 5C6A]|nr:hypothetical protein DL771_007516 [Monosporascus sp. 5C6A]
MPPPPVPAPSLDIPPSSNTVKVSIIDSATQMTGLPAASFFEPRIQKVLRVLVLFSNRGVSDILEENGVEPGAITDIIWSHRHLDHTGDPSVFPASTNLDVGLGFRDAVSEGYLQKEDSVCTSSAWEDRHSIELDFAAGGRVGGWDAIDCFGDGSFYVLHSPGHANEHLCSLAAPSWPPTRPRPDRTSSSS